MPFPTTDSRSHRPARALGTLPRSLLQASRALALVVACTAGPAGAWAQTLTFGAGAAAGDAGAGALAHVTASEVRTAGGVVTAGLVASPAPGVDVAVRDARALGALGTLTFEVEGGARGTTEGLRGRLRVVARGGFGPVAGHVEARAWGAPPERFDPLSDPGPVRAEAGTSLHVSADGRLDRTWLLGGETRLERGGDGALAVDLRAELRGRRLIAPTWDGVARAAARVAGSGDGRFGVSVGFVHTPRRAPEVGASLHLDARPARDGVALRPGVEGYGGTTLAGGRLELRLRLRPAAPDRAPLFASAAWRLPAGDGAVRVAVTAMHGPRTGAAAAASLAYERPLVLP